MFQGCGSIALKLGVGCVSDGLTVVLAIVVVMMLLAFIATIMQGSTTARGIALLCFAAAIVWLLRQITQS